MRRLGEKPKVRLQLYRRAAVEPATTPPTIPRKTAFRRSWGRLVELLALTSVPFRSR